MTIGGGDNELNYSLGILIVLLLMFWFVCKCIGPNGNVRHEYMKNPRLRYANAPINLDYKSNLKYIRMDQNGTIQVPNSKTSVRHLSDESHNYASIDTILSKDNEPSTMHLMKRGVEKHTNKPRGLTDQRYLSTGDGTRRIMPSY